jgi:tetratricopeptide (TPR) repeat protein
MIIRLATLSLVSFLCCAAALAQHPGAKKPDTPMPPLMEGLGTAEIKITTADPMAQAYFNQGLRFIYAFNHEEAIRAFRAAETIDPDCAMAQWGVAVALGPNYNMEADPEKAEVLLTALRKAQQLAMKATPKEQAYVAAATKRYSEDPKADRKLLDRAYADAMCELAAKYPDDLDAAVLAAESMMQLRPWDLWTADGSTPLPGTEEIVSRLEAVLAKNPKHTGANHYHIHACEASKTPERALPSAKRLGELAPGAGHLIHMPSHIFFRLGMYEDAVKSNEQAVAVDEVYLAKHQPTGAYPMMYYPHNIHFLWAALTMEGRSADAIATATRMSEKLTPEMVKEMAIVEYFLPVRWYALTKFGKWDEMLQEKGPPEELTFARGIWHYARGKAFAGKDQLAESAIELAGLEKSLAATPQDTALMRHSTPQLLAIAQHDLAADLSARAGVNADAIAQLRVAVLLQDQVLYDEPPPWYTSERVALAKVLLSANKAEEAEAVLREDLKRSPHSGWALFLLEKAVRAQNRVEDADQIQAEFKKAWVRADFTLQ